VREAKDVCLKNSPSCVVSVKELGFERTLTQAAAEAATRVITARMVAPLERLLDRLGSLDVDAKSISGIELFGGASRFTPLQTAAAAVAKRHGLKLGHRLNTELSAAQGAARIAASIVNPTARRVSLVEMQSLPAPGARERATPLSDLSLRLLRGNLAESLALEQTLAARAAARSDFETFLGSASETLEALEASGTNVDAARAALSAQRDFLDLAADESTTVEEFSARLQNLKSVLAQGGGKAKAEL
jgi:hypothetical protein